MIVADANIIIYLVRDTPYTALARQAYAKDSDWMVPGLWEAEVLNGLMREVRAGHIGLEDAIQAASNAAGLLSNTISPCDRASVLRTAKDTGLTAYDAYYVALARSLGVSLLTEDSRVRTACPDLALSLGEFLGLKKGPRVIREPRGTYRAHRK